MTDKELRDAAVAELKLTEVGWLKKSGGQWVTRYPSGPPAGTHWRAAMDSLAQIGAVPVPSPPPEPEPEPEPTPVPVGSALSFPASGHIWGGNSATAMVTHDIVIASDASQGVPKQARAAGNPGLIALQAGALDPWNADWTKRRSFGLTYGSGLQQYTGGITDSLQPNPLGALRAYTSADNGCNAQHGMHWNLSRQATADLVRQAAWYSWKLGKGAENGWNGQWSDNFFPGNLLAAGWAFGSCAATLPKAAWDAGMLNVCNGLRSLGVPMVGGNTVYRSDNPAVRVATNVAMNETLEAQINQGPTVYQKFLDEAFTWQKAAPGPRYLVSMHIVPQSNAALMKFGLAIATIAGSAYIPYSNGHHDLYLPAEMKRNGARHYLGKPTADPTRSGNTWTRQFEHGSVSANFDTKTATFS